MASRFEGSYRNGAERVKRSNGSKMPRGIKRMTAWLKQDEAFARNASTPHDRTKHHRLRCSEMCER